MLTLEARYQHLLANGELRPDPDQAAAVARLGALRAQLTAPAPLGLFGRWRGKSAPPPRSLYLWGDVGRGKSMLMDVFVESLTGIAARRAHFHEFMQDVHARLHRLRAAPQQGGNDPIATVAAALARPLRLLALDELVITNMADAAIVSRLFTAMLDLGLTIVTTSNRPPTDLYKNGLNRELFLPFIALVEARFDIIALNGPTDYRRQRMAGVRVWHAPMGPDATRAVSEAFFRLTDFEPEDRAHVPSAELDTGWGRTLFVPKSLKGVAVFSFRRLCGQPVGAADYLALARHYHTVILVGIPRLGPENRNEAARLVTLIDALYEQHVKLIAIAETAPEDLYPHGDGRFEFQRTLSRLAEMQSQAYLERGHGCDTETPPGQK